MREVNSRSTGRAGPRGDECSTRQPLVGPSAHGPMRAFDPRLRSAAKPTNTTLTVRVRKRVLLMNHVLITTPRWQQLGKTSCWRGGVFRKAPRSFGESRMPLVGETSCSMTCGGRLGKTLLFRIAPTGVCWKSVYREKPFLRLPGSAVRPDRGPVRGGSRRGRTRPAKTIDSGARWQV